LLLAKNCIPVQEFAQRQQTACVISNLPELNVESTEQKEKQDKTIAILKDYRFTN
jgi:hypothetical protein